MFATPAYAQTAGAAANGGAFGFIIALAPWILIFGAFWFLMIRPQQKRASEQRKAIEAARKGDMVTTAGGIVGKVTKVEDAIVEVEVAQGVRVKVVKSTLAGIEPLGGKPAND